MNSADIARKNGWVVGTRLLGSATEHEGSRVMVITAIGEREVLGKTLEISGEATESPRETVRDFTYRPWVAETEQGRAILEQGVRHCGFGFGVDECYLPEGHDGVHAFHATSPTS